MSGRDARRLIRGNRLIRQALRQYQRSRQRGWVLRLHTGYTGPRGLS